MTKLRVFAVLPALMFAFFGFGGAALAQESDTNATTVDETPVEAPATDTLVGVDAGGDVFVFAGVTGDIAILQDNLIIIVNNSNIGNTLPVEDAVDDGAEDAVDDGAEDAVDDGAEDAVDDGAEDAVDDGAEDAVDDGAEEGDATVD